VSSSWVTFVFEAANFLLLAAVLGWLFFRPVRAALERRRSALEGEQRAAADARAEAERVLQETRARRAELEGSLEELRLRVEREAESERERLMDQARDQTRSERENAKGEIVSLRRAQARTLTRDAAFAAREIVVRLLAQMEGPELERSLRRAACRELETLRSAGPLAPVVIESAMALDDEDRAALAAAAGVDARDAAHRVDPELVAGVRVITARGLVDASAAGLAAQAEGILVSHLDRESSERG
jgi:F-type H+-transporting ATPase subunit b